VIVSGYRISRPEFVQGEIDHVCDGDLFLYRGSGLISRAVSHICNSPYSHVSVAIRVDGVLSVIQATGGGVHLARAKDSFRDYPGIIELFKPTVQIELHNRDLMLAFAMEQIGKKYNLSDVVGNTARVVFGRPLWGGKELSLPASRYYCSQFVCDVYRSVGIRLCNHLSSNRVSPGNIAESRLLRRVDVYFSKQRPSDIGLSEQPFEHPDTA